MTVYCENLLHSGLASALKSRIRHGSKKVLQLSAHFAHESGDRLTASRDSIGKAVSGTEAFRG